MQVERERKIEKESSLLIYQVLSSSNNIPPRQTPFTLQGIRNMQIPSVLDSKCFALFVVVVVVYRANLAAVYSFPEGGARGTRAEGEQK